MSVGAPLRRLLMTSDAVGGVWTYALELAAGLATHGVSTTLAVLGPPPDSDQRRQADGVPGLELMITGLELEWQDRKGLGDHAARQHLRTLAARFQPDLVHVNGFREAAYGWEQPVVLVAHSCVRSWWRACRGGEPPAEWAAYLDAVGAGLAAADAVVAPTAAFMAELDSLYGPLANPLVIHNGRDLTAPAVERQRCILAAGRLWDEGKNMAALAQIATRLPWPVLVAGDLPAGRAHPDLVHLGRLEQAALAQAMATSEIFCAPARYEPFGLAVLEAARCGAALVLGNTPSLIELWGDAARFIDPDDADGLAGVLRDLIEDPRARKQLQVAARSVAQRFSRARMAEAYLNLYAALVAGRDGRGRAA